MMIRSDLLQAVMSHRATAPLNHSITLLKYHLTARPHGLATLPDRGAGPWRTGGLCEVKQVRLSTSSGLNGLNGLNGLTTDILFE